MRSRTDRRINLGGNCEKIIYEFSAHTIPEVMSMNVKLEKQNQKLANEEFNSVTQKVKPVNQNQSHNVIREGMGPNTKRKAD